MVTMDDPHFDLILYIFLHFQFSFSETCINIESRVLKKVVVVVVVDKQRVEIYSSTCDKHLRGYYCQTH